MAQRKNDATEMCVILPYTEYRSLEQKAKKEVTSQALTEHPRDSKEEDPKENIDSSDEIISPSPVQSKDSSNSLKEGKKELKNNYRSVQIKKLLHHIKKVNPSQDITSLENLDELIKCALGSSKKTLLNEAKFFNFLEIQAGIILTNWAIVIIKPIMAKLG